MQVALRLLKYRKIHVSTEKDSKEFGSRVRTFQGSKGVSKSLIAHTVENVTLDSTDGCGVICQIFCGRKLRVSHSTHLNEFYPQIFLRCVKRGKHNTNN